MWNDILGTLGKAIEDAFSEDLPKNEINLPLPSTIKVLPSSKVNTSTNDEYKLRLPDISFQKNVENTLDSNTDEVFFSETKNEEELFSRKEDSTIKKNMGDPPLSSSVHEPVLELSFDHTSTISPMMDNVVTAMQSSQTCESSQPFENLYKSVVAKSSSLTDKENVSIYSTSSPFSKGPFNSLGCESDATCEPHEAPIVCHSKDESLSYESPQTEIEEEAKSKRSYCEGSPLKTIQKGESKSEDNVDSNQMKSLIEKLEGDNKILNYLSTELKEELTKKSELLEISQKKVHELQEENKRCNIEIFQLTKKNLNYEDRNISRLQEEKNSLEKETERLSSELQATIEEYENRLGKTDISIIEANKRANDAEMRFLEKEREAAFSLQNVRCDIESLHALLSQLSSSKSQLEGENEFLRKENTKLKLSSLSNSKSLEDIIAQQKVKIDEELSLNLRLRSQLKELEKQYSDCALQLSQHEKEVKSLKLRLLTAAEFTSNSTDSNKNAFSGGSTDFKGNYSWRTSRFVDLVETNDEDKSKTRLEQEVIRQALVIKDLRKEILSLQSANNL